MRINSFDNNSDKTSFGWIIPLNNAEKKCGLETYRFVSRVNGLDDYDVYVKPLKTKTTRERDLGCLLAPLIYSVTIFASLIGGFGGSFYLFTNFLPNLAGGFLQLGVSVLSGLGLAGATINAVMFKKYNDFSVQAATQRGNERDKDNNPTPAGIITKEHIVKNDGSRYNPHVDFVGEIRNLKRKMFNDFIKHYDTNDLFEPKNYARVLRNRPQELDSQEFFNYKIDYMGNTLLTAFFDVVPNDREYHQIIKYLKSQKNLDFSQKDGNGISCIEKVLISENKEALDVILNAKYTGSFKKPYGWKLYEPYLSEEEDKSKIIDPSKIIYSPELDDIYSNIQDKEFKKIVDDNIKWDFSNWIAVIQSHDVSKAEKLKQRFSSPLLNNPQQLYNDINKALSDCKDMNFITYMQTNFLPELQKIIKEK